MKKIVLSLFAISSLIACKKECDKCETKDCEINPDSTLVCKTNLSSGLLAYYPFNGNSNDESGNGNNAVSKNGAYLTSDFVGRANNCAGFDGYDDYFLVPASTKLNSDTMTLSFQVMVNSANRRHALVSRVNFENATSVIWAVGVSLPGDNKFSFATRPGTEDCSYLGPADYSLSLYDQANYQTGRWYNIISTFAGGVQKIYVNGVLQSSATRSYTKLKHCANANLAIGGWWKSDIASPDGKIDEVRLYNRVLSDCEISKLAESFK